MGAITGPPAAPLRGLPPEGRTVPALLQRQAERWGEKMLVRVGEDERTFAGAEEAAARAAATLARSGIERGDRVAIMCGNRIELLDLTLGCAWLGAVAVPLNTAVRGRQLDHVLSNSGASLLILEAGLLPALEAIDPPSSLERVWVLDGAPAQTGASYGLEPAPAPEGAVPAAPVGAEETTAIFYTSGTTGPAKGVCVPQAQLYWWGICASELLEATAADVHFNPLPLFHINAVCTVFQALLTGGACVLPERFSASRFWAQAAEAEATVAYLLGAMVSIISARAEDPAERAHRVRVALAPATPAPLVEPFRDRFGVQLVEGYGSTETNCVIGAQPGEQRPGWIGYVRDGFEAKVVDELDVEVPADTPGELVLRHRDADAFASGYFRMPEKTVEAWRNLWFHTGDQVIRDGDGWFRFLDRGKDGIRRRGENISSFEVEEALVAHEAVAVAAVFAVPSELGEDEVMAAILVEEGRSVDPVELMRHCEPRLAYFAIPRYVEFVEELPLTENGKVRKAELRERGVTEATWDRDAAGYRVSRS